MNTTTIQKRIEQIFEELKKFSSEIIELNPPVEMNIIDKFEKEFDLRLPEDYKFLLQLTNGFNLMGDEVLGITFNKHDYDLVCTYDFEHYKTNNPIPKHLIPFSPDGGGNFYCFDTLKKTDNGLSYSIVFWASDYEYTEEDQPEDTHNDLTDFINECIIGWTLEDYNYDGSKK